MEEALLDVGWEAPKGSVLRLACPGHGIMLVRLRSPDDDSFAVAMANACRDALLRRLAGRPGGAPRVVAAIGDPQVELPRAACSYRQARLAAKVATAIPTMGDVVHWGSLGAFRALVQLPNREAVQSALDPRVVALLRSGDDALAVTLETYLDLGGDAKATAERLHVHRATLYFRLNKAQQLASIDVRNGYDRLAVHLGLKLVRLAGVDGEMWHQGGPVPARQTPTAGKTEEDGGLSAISARS